MAAEFSGMVVCVECEMYVWIRRVGSTEQRESSIDRNARGVWWYIIRMSTTTW